MCIFYWTGSDFSSYEQHNLKRVLRSAGQVLLVQPRSRLRCTDDLAFAIVVLRLWNNPPPAFGNAESLECFKTSLKTHLFDLAFDLSSAQARMGCFSGGVFRLPWAADVCLCEFCHGAEILCCMYFSVLFLAFNFTIKHIGRPLCAI